MRGTVRTSESRRPQKPFIFRRQAGKRLFSPPPPATQINRLHRFLRPTDTYTDPRATLVHLQREVRFWDVIPQVADYIPQEYYFASPLHSGRRVHDMRCGNLPQIPPRPYLSTTEDGVSLDLSQDENDLGVVDEKTLTSVIDS